VIERVDPEPGQDERTTMLAFLDYHRQTFELKCEGLDAEQLARRSVPPSTMSLLGILRHLAEVERSWFDRVAGRTRPEHYCTEAEPDADFDGAIADPAVVAEAFANWKAAIVESRVVAATAGLDDWFSSRHGRLAVRWLYAHLLEEYARHNGHADLLRETIDGATGE
jgi:uncharacterized damage-inducible protein DinB